MILTPNIWGPHIWKALHLISFAYPNDPNENQKKTYKSFFETFYGVIPCSICSANYQRHIKELPITDDTMKNRDSLVKWVIDMHNLVNKENGKPIYSYDDAINTVMNNFKDMESMSSVQTETSTPNFVWILIIILVLLVIIAVIYKKN